jgi:cyclase
MSRIRLIARLDIKVPNLIKTINLEGVRKLGDPKEFAWRYYRDGIDEILYMDVVASLYDRQAFEEILSWTANNVFVPITAGGGVRTMADVDKLLRAGADKVAVNTAAIRNPGFITEIARKYGSQCCVLSIEAQRHGPGQWEAYCDGGREHTGLDVIEWAERGQQLGAGEILLTCINNEGVKVGFDVPLVRAVRDRVTIPIIASGGMGQFAHLVEVTQQGGADAVVMAYVLHYGLMTVPEIRQRALAAGLDLREAA